MFSVTSSVKHGRFWWNLVYRFPIKFASEWSRRFPLHLNNSLRHCSGELGNVYIVLNFEAKLFRKRCTKFRQNRPTFMGDIIKNVLVSFFLDTGIFDLFCFCDLDLNPMTFIYELDPYFLEIYQMWNMNFLRQGVKAFESYRLTDRQTDRHDRNYTPIREWSNMLNDSKVRAAKSWPDNFDLDLLLWSAYRYDTTRTDV